MKMINIRVFWLSCGLLALLAACDSGVDGEAGGSDSETISRQIAGNSALGRPASWSNNCLDEMCSRADEDGNYLLITPASASALMWSDIPEVYGEDIRLFSRYRFDSERTSATVNFNPSTHALLDAWAMQSQGTTIELCSESSTCANALISSFTQELEDTMVSQLDTLLGEAWPEGRNPFEDLYQANSTDLLDVMHDYLNFVVAASEFSVYDNDGVLLTSIPLASLIQAAPIEDSVLLDSQYAQAQTIFIEEPDQTIISFDVRISPGNLTAPPVDIYVDASRSSSLNLGELIIEHDLTLANGETSHFSGAMANTTITSGGDHIWVTTITDSSGYHYSQGYVLSVPNGEDEPPQFGGDGSCFTPESAMDANSLNICQETQNGSDMGSCDVINSSSVTLSSSSAPCAREVQNDGDLLGVCTILTSEIRIFYYENPLRPNNVETFEDKQNRTESFCHDSFLGDWSTNP